jgi:hypothetical protein
MSTEKVSLSIDANLLAEARRRVGDGRLSAYVSKGLRRQNLADRQEELLRDWEAEFGPIPEVTIEEMATLWPD